MTESQREEIDRIWESRLLENPTLFDGLQVRLDSWTTDAGRLLLNTSVTSYREFVGTNLAYPEWYEDSGDEFMSNPIGVSGSIITRDNFLVFGVRGSKVAEYPGCIDTIGGNLSPSLHLTNEGVDPFRAFINEVCEELTLTEPEIESVVASGLWRNSETLRPEIVFRLALSAYRPSVRLKDDEHSELIFVPFSRANVIEFGEAQRGKITPSCMAALKDLVE